MIYVGPMLPAPAPSRGGASPTAEELEETFALFRTIGLGIRARFAEAMRAHGLTFAQVSLMKRLRETGRLTVRELADALEVTPANVTGIVDRLEREGLVTRARSGEDRRVVFVRLTENGHQRMDAVKREGSGRVLAEAFEGWTSEELAELRGLLGRLRIRHDDPECP
jgi:DNA-binding MarR family transcriptional regulator